MFLSSICFLLTLSLVTLSIRDANDSVLEPDATNPDGLLQDLDNIVIDLPSPKEKRLSASADVKYFFDNARALNEGEATRKVHDCTICRCVFLSTSAHSDGRY